MRAIRIAMLGMALASGLAYAIEPEAKVVSQPDAPVTITHYSAAYQASSRYGNEGIHHNVEYTNSGTKPIVAVQIGLVSFDIWNEFLDRTGGISIEDMMPGSTKEGTWVALSYGDFSFLTGVAYVSKARFLDGTIWDADLSAIAEELRKIEEDFDARRLDGKKE